MSASHAAVIDVEYPASTDFPMHEHESAYLCFVAEGGYEEWWPGHRQALEKRSHRLYLEGSRHAVRTGPGGTRVLHVTDPLAEGWRGGPSPDFFR